MRRHPYEDTMIVVVAVDMMKMIEERVDHHILLHMRNIETMTIEIKEIRDARDTRTRSRTRVDRDTPMMMMMIDVVLRLIQEEMVMMMMNLLIIKIKRKKKRKKIRQ